MRNVEKEFDGRKHVTESTDSQGNKIVTIVSGEKEVTRKEHKFKEFELKDGD